MHCGRKEGHKKRLSLGENHKTILSLKSSTDKVEISYHWERGSCPTLGINTKQNLAAIRRKSRNAERDWTPEDQVHTFPQDSDWGRMTEKFSCP